jgi:pyruvate ferredoxin oxidoreductase alpha subunit
MVNIDGFVLTHTYEEVYVPSAEEIKKFLPAYEPKTGEYLDVKNPVTLGAFAAPPYYMEIREDLHNTLHKTRELILKQRDLLAELIPEAAKPTEKNATINNGLLEYYGAPKADTIFIALGSLAGTVKDAVDEMNKKKVLGGVAIVKIKSFRPFPDEDLLKAIHQAKYVAVLEKAVSLGASAGPLALEVKACCKNKCQAKVQGFVVGLGGRDITKAMIAKAAGLVKKSGDQTIFIGN